VGWVLSVIDQIKFLTSPPSVAVLPLGTGNDLARALNWGGAYTNESLGKLLAKTLESRNVKLDRWKILTQVNQSASDLKQQSKENSSTENAIEKLKNDVMNNYFSIGADAHVCLEFHERRGTQSLSFCFST
jgi:diacylglycerol kinase (ATP)